MNKLYALIAVAVVLSACSKEEGGASAPTPAPAPAASAPEPAAAPAAAPAPEPAAAAPAAAPAPTASADLPQECQDYLNKVSACVAKQSGPAAEAMKTSMEQAKQSWAALGGAKDQITAACKTAGESFEAQAKAMNC